MSPAEVVKKPTPKAEGFREPVFREHCGFGHDKEPFEDKEGAFEGFC